MSDPLSVLLQSGERASGHDDSNMTAEAIYDDLFRSLRPEDPLPGEGETSQNMSGLNVSTIGDAGMDLFGQHDDLEGNATGAVSAQGQVQSQVPSIPIPPTLAGIAEKVKPLDLTFDDPVLGLTFEPISDRGEMGGKRKKALEDRAGWKDMDEHGNMPKRPRGKRANKDVKMTVEDFVGYGSDQRASGTPGDQAGASGSGGLEEGMGGHDAAQTTLEQDLQATAAGMGIESDALADVLRHTHPELLADAGIGGMQSPSGLAGGENAEAGPAKGQSQESRSEQNRRAQQVYRRRREERIKELEAQAAALEPTRRALFESHEKLKAVALEYESTQIQLSALQSTLLNLNKRNISILTSQYNFPMDATDLKETETMRPGPIAESDVTKAFEQLARQSKALAVSRRA